MNAKTASELDSVLNAPLGFYMQADSIMRLMTRENVSEILERLPRSFRAEFLDFARRAYIPRTERLAVSGPPLPEACVDALRQWFLAAHDLAVARARRLLLLARSMEREAGEAQAPAELPFLDVAGEGSVPRRRATAVGAPEV